MGRRCGSILTFRRPFCRCAVQHRSHIHLLRGEELLERFLRRHLQCLHLQSAGSVEQRWRWDGLKVQISLGHGPCVCVCLCVLGKQGLPCWQTQFLSTISEVLFTKFPLHVCWLYTWTFYFIHEILPFYVDLFTKFELYSRIFNLTLKRKTLKKIYFLEYVFLFLWPPSSSIVFCIFFPYSGMWKCFS